jgi:hypothetical protein
MQETVQQIEQWLAEAKERELQDQIDKSIAEASKWIGKCYSSHLFQRVPKAGRQITVQRIDKVEYNKNRSRIEYQGTRVTLQAWTDDKFSFDINTCSSDTPFPSWIASFSHEIEPALFERILLEARAHADGYFDKIAGLFKQTQYITQGDSTMEGRKCQMVSKYFHLVNIKDKHRVAKDVLSWNYHPFLYDEDTFTVSKESLAIVIDIADAMEESARSWGGSILERDMPRVRALRAFHADMLTLLIAKEKVDHEQ